MKKSVFNYAIVLTVIAVASGMALGFFNTITAGPIAENQRAREEAAVQSVLGTGDFQEITLGGRKLYQAETTEGTLVAFTTAPPGFSGPISLMVSVNVNSQSIQRVSVLEHTETPGLGARIQENWFTDQFTQKALDEPFKVKGDVEAITGATISSWAVSMGIKEDAAEVLALVKAGGNGE